MAKRSGRKHTGKPATPARGGGIVPAPAAADRGTAEPQFAPPFRPRKGLLVALSVVLAVWLAFLLALYFKTVRPHTADPLPAAQPTTLPGSEHGAPARAARREG